MQYDIFISYARVDDTALATPWEAVKENTWARCFKVALQQALDRILGRKNDARIFFDLESMGTGDDLTDRIKSALDQTRIFVALVSNGSIHDDSYCRMEREHFIASLGADPSGQKRVFGVLLGEESLEDWKSYFFPDVLAFPFYDRPMGETKAVRLGEGEIDKAFVNRISRLASDLAERILELRSRTNTVPDSSPQLRKGKVFLAAVPGELEEVRSELVNLLEMEQWSVIPRDNVCPAAADECSNWATNLMNEKDLAAFVQIIGAYPWLPGHYDRIQFDMANEASTAECLTYRMEGIDLAKVRNEDHRAWLEASLAKTIPLLKAELPEKLSAILIQRKTAEAERVKQTDGSIAYVSLSIGTNDRAMLSQQLLDSMEQQQVYGDLGVETPAELEQVFLNQDGFLAVFGNETFGRLECLLREWRVMLGKHRRPNEQNPPLGLLLLDPPPVDKRQSINIRLPGMQIFDWSDTSGLERFLTATRQFAARKGGAA